MPFSAHAKAVSETLANCIIMYFPRLQSQSEIHRGSSSATKAMVRQCSGTTVLIEGFRALDWPSIGAAIGISLKAVKAMPKLCQLCLVISPAELKLDCSSLCTYSQPALFTKSMALIAALLSRSITRVTVNPSQSWKGEIPSVRFRIQQETRYRYSHRNTLEKHYGVSITAL